MSHLTQPAPTHCIRGQSGTEAEAHTTLWYADTPSPRGTVAVLHGGYWRAAFTSELMAPIAGDLVKRGWNVANIEYRRVGAGGGWPLPLRDTIEACHGLARSITAGHLPGPLILLGHSVGGELALLAAKELPHEVLAGVIALSPVTDVITSWQDRLGDNAVNELFAASSGDPIHIAESASPIHQLPIGTTIQLIHGRDDLRVPIEHSERFAKAARLAGDQVNLHAPLQLEHRKAIDPAAQHWPLVIERLLELSMNAHTAQPVSSLQPETT